MFMAHLLSGNYESKLCLDHFIQGVPYKTSDHIWFNNEKNNLCLKKEQLSKLLSLIGQKRLCFDTTRVFIGSC